MKITYLNIFIAILNIFSYGEGADIAKYQDAVPYDEFINDIEPVTINSDTKIESGQSLNSSNVSKPGKLYVITSDLKISKDMNWGGNTNSLVLGNSWENTSISIIVIKHPENKPIIIESKNNSTITLGRAALIDIQSPVIFKNVKIHRANDGPNSTIYQYGKNTGWKLGSYGLYSSAVIVRAPVKFENCTFSTSNGGGIWSDIHLTTPGNSTLEFYNNTYNIKRFYVNSNTKGAVIPIFKTNEREKLQPLVSAISGNRKNIAITSSMLNDIDNSENIYFSVGNVDPNNSKIFYITDPNPMPNNLDEIQAQCLQFLQKFCNYPSSKNNIELEMCTSLFISNKTTNNEQLNPQSEPGNINDITKYQDSVPYDSFMYNSAENKLDANASVTGRGIYTIDSDMKITRGISWGSGTNPVIGTSWNDTTVSIILIKHPQNKPITIESTNNSTITLEKGSIIDIQSPVIFKNVRIYRSPSAGNTRINTPSNGQACQTSAGSNIWSGCFMLRAPIKFQNCTFSTPDGTGCWSDIHCLSPYAPLIEFENNRYETRQIYFYKNKKISTIPLLKISTKDVSKFKSFVKTDGASNNISINSTMLDDITDSNTIYYPIGKFNRNNGKILYITSSISTVIKDENNIWCKKPKESVNVNGNYNVKEQCLKFLQKYCGESNDNTNINIESYTAPYVKIISILQLLARTGYINVDLEKEDEYPTNDWFKTVKEELLPVPVNNSNIAEISVGMIGSKNLKIQVPEKTNILKLSGDLSRYKGILTIPSNVTRICLTKGNRITFGIDANHNIELDCEKSDTLNILGDFSKCTGIISFSNKIKKILLPTDKLPFTIGGSSDIVLGATSPTIDTMTFKSNILERKGKVLVDTNIKTVSIE